MSTENTSLAPNPPADSATPARRTLGQKFYLVATMIVGIGVLIAGGASILGFVTSFFMLPGCDSQTAKDTLSDVFKQNKLNPLRYDSTETVSSNKDTVVCKATLPMPDGSTLVADYSLFWQGNSAQIKYNLSQLPAGQSGKTSPSK